MSIENEIGEVYEPGQDEERKAALKRMALELKDWIINHVDEIDCFIFAAIRGDGDNNAMMVTAGTLTQTMAMLNGIADECARRRELWESTEGGTKQ